MQSHDFDQNVGSHEDKIAVLERSLVDKNHNDKITILDPLEVNPVAI